MIEDEILTPNSYHAKLKFWRPTIFNYHLHDYAKLWEKKSGKGSIDLQIVVRGPGNRSGVKLNWDDLRHGITTDGGFNTNFLQNTLSDLRGAKKLVLGCMILPSGSPRPQG